MKIFKIPGKGVKSDTFDVPQIREMVAMKKLKKLDGTQSNVMCAMHIVQRKDNECSSIIMERMHGSLNNLRERILSVEVQRSILRQVAHGLLHIHNHGFIHRDIKSENILYKETEEGQYTVKIGDLGMARRMCQSMTPRRMTVNYRAPELMDVTNRQYTTAIDIWGLSMVACELYGRKQMNPEVKTDDTNIFTTKDGVDAFDVRVNGYLYQMRGCDDRLMVALEAMMKRDPDQRPSAEDLLTKFQWFKM
jgi:serine/threonine protein kinase